MKEKIKVDENNYKEIILKRSIIICWIILGICLVVKLLGGDYFAITCENKNFIKFCDYIDKSPLAYIIRLFSFLSSSYLVFKSVDYNTTRKQTIIFLGLCFLSWCYKHLINVGIIYISTILYNIFDFIVLYVLLLVCTFKGRPIRTRIVKPLIFIFLLFVFSLVSTIIKNVGIKNSLNSYFLQGVVFMVDYYIMLVLTYLYTKRRCIKWENGDGSRG